MILSATYRFVSPVGWGTGDVCCACTPAGWWDKALVSDCRTYQASPSWGPAACRPACAGGPFAGPWGVVGPSGAAVPFGAGDPWVLEVHQALLVHSCAAVEDGIG